MRPGDTRLTRRRAIERMVLLQEFSPRRQTFDRAVHGITARLSSVLVARWLLLVNVGLGVLIGGAVMVPLLFVWGWSDLGSRLFRLYHLVCGQLPSHSYFLFGYQLALCARNLAIYSALLGGSLAYRAVRTRLPSLAWYLWLLTLLPMGVDGITQLFGLRESTWELRTATGALFGLGVSWFILPRIEKAIGPSAGVERAGARMLSGQSGIHWPAPDDASSSTVVSHF